MGEPGPLFAELTARFGGAVLAGSQDPPFEVVEVAKEQFAAVAGFLKADRGFDMLMDLTAVDYLHYRSVPKPARFEVIAYLFSLKDRRRVRLKAPVPDTDTVVPTLTGLFGDANWLEREVWDMYGIRFAGHPDLRRLLMYEEFSGHPLRKDYPLLKQQPRVAQVFPGVPPFGEKPDRLRVEDR